MNTWNRKVKCLKAFGPRRLDSLFKRFCTKLLRGRWEPNPQKFSSTSTQYLLGRDEEIYGDLCIFLATCTKPYWFSQDEHSVGMHNLCFMPQCRDFASCRPAKYIRLPVQQVKIYEKQFLLVIFGARYKILQGLISLLFVTTLKFRHNSQCHGVKENTPQRPSIKLILRIHLQEELCMPGSSYHS